jgi:hypothetical protein
LIHHLYYKQNMCASFIWCLEVHRKFLCLLLLCVYAGLGGLINIAEMAWQQDDDIYSSNQYALATVSTPCCTLRRHSAACSIQ